MPETAALVIFMRQRIRSRWISGRHVVGRLDEALGMDLACRRRWRGRNVKNAIERDMCGMSLLFMSPAESYLLYQCIVTSVWLLSFLLLVK
ncbi:hypothetical protein I7I53_12081 [Histoplasma capsulatum var. duboisii H88]|uniref:Uncharacterized protein n=1 Tax=Ajellomyces capsulatus (strain H88) TaxID=544711 RepID=A0A8A1LVJ0_AJEC8|nr:hypothetical protein I7I53_12081 [Histoplasma capsulatum var. duboisii H88]